MDKPIWTYNRTENAYSAVFPDSPVQITVTCDGNAIFYRELGRERCADTVQRLPLVEGGTYHYRLSDQSARLHADSSFVGAVRSREGGLQPRTAVGYGRLWLKNASKVRQSLEIEVASKVINYKDHYQQFLQEITDRVAALQMYSSAATHSRLIADFHKEKCKSHEALVREMFFIIGLISNERFRAAVRRIMVNPHSALRDVEEAVDVRRSMRVTRNALVQIMSASRRVESRDCGLDSVPERLWSVRREETRDTKENRFVKHVLCFFRSKLERCRKLINEGATGKNGCAGSVSVLVELDEAISMLRGLTNHPFFRDVGRLTTMPSGSVVLQRREGYREVLKKWIQFHAATNLASDDIDDIFRANQRNMATLYEYWCFFRLLDIVKDRFHISDSAIVESIVGTAEDNVSFSLRRGKKLPLTGSYEYPDSNGQVRYRKLTIGYFYNRVFSPAQRLGKARRRAGWTFQMKPDYTIAFYPAGMTEGEAVDNDLITYVHFDAKYKVSEVRDVIKTIERSRRPDSNDEGDDDCEDGDRTGDVKSRRDVKHVDILKMHAYRDAVYRTGGAYVLYPGDEDSAHNWTKYDFEDELFPAVGAFPMSPSIDSKEAISEFLAKTAGFLCDKITRWEEFRYQQHRIYEDGVQKRGNIVSPPELLKVDFVKGLYDAVIKSGRCPCAQCGSVLVGRDIKWLIVQTDDGVPRVFRVKNDVPPITMNFDSFRREHNLWGGNFSAVRFPYVSDTVLCVWRVEEAL